MTKTAAVAAATGLNTAAAASDSSSRHSERTKLQGAVVKADYQTMTSEIQMTPTNPDLGQSEISIEGHSKVGKNGKIKVPRRLIYCSDGVVEEYSTDEDEVDEVIKKEEEEAKRLAAIDPKKLRWIPWMVHFSWLGGSKFLKYCDSAGERLAWFFGITSPKYYYEIEEYKREKALQQEQVKKEEEKSQAWKSETTLDSQNPIALDPAKLTQTSSNQ